MSSKSFVFINTTDVQLTGIGYIQKRSWIAKDLQVYSWGHQDVASLGFHEYPIMRSSFDYRLQYSRNPVGLVNCYRRGFLIWSLYKSTCLVNLEAFVSTLFRFFSHVRCSGILCWSGWVHPTHTYRLKAPQRRKFVIEFVQLLVRPSSLMSTSLSQLISDLPFGVYTFSSLCKQLKCDSHMENVMD